MDFFIVIKQSIMNKFRVSPDLGRLLASRVAPHDDAQGHHMKSLPQEKFVLISHSFEALKHRHSAQPIFTARKLRSRDHDRTSASNCFTFFIGVE